MRIILSRTDSIGDVVLTLPVACILKRTFPGCTVIFLGREYTRPVIEACEYVDEFVNWAPSPALPQTGEGGSVGLLSGLKADVMIHVFPVKEICRAAKQARIPVRIATAGRSFTWFTCNRLVHIPRKNSGLHEAQLNLSMLKPLGIDREFSLGEIAGMYGLKGGQAEVPDRKSVILHPKSKGSAREWGLDNYSRLIDLLPPEKYEILVTGTAGEGALMRPFLEKHRERITDLTGRLTLAELMELIARCDGLVAASTGPLHLAAALGIRAVGLYAPMRPIFPQRWAPVGEKATFLVLDKKCSDCRKNMDCACIRAITPEAVAEKLAGAAG
jgi:ADP-heptose:LPS heptosyltransferase